MEDLELLLEELKSAGYAHHLEDHIPAALRGWLLDINWDRDKLWSLELPVRKTDLYELRWHLKLPWWRNNGRWFQVKPSDVLLNPHGFPQHKGRLESIDIDEPIHVIRRKNRLLILDGIHRLAKAEALGRSAIPSKEVEPEHLRAIATVPPQ